MADDLVFYTNPQSRGRIARWMLEEAGADYRTEVVDYAARMKSPEYLAINPMGKVPAIVHNGKVVTEGAAICAYLAEAFPQAGLAPQPHERANYYRWLFFAAGPVEQAVTNNFAKFDPSPEQRGRSVTATTRRRSMCSSRRWRRTTISPAIASRPPMSMSDRRWAGASCSGRCRSATHSLPISRD